MSQTYNFKMEMTCEGCANAARRVLAKLGDKVTDVKTSVAEQSVTVTTTADQSEILAQLQKTGKNVQAL